MYPTPEELGIVAVRVRSWLVNQVLVNILVLFLKMPILWSLPEIG